MYLNLLTLKFHLNTNIPLRLCNGWLNRNALTLPLMCQCYPLTTLTPSEGHFVASFYIMYYLRGENMVKKNFWKKGKHNASLALSYVKYMKNENVLVENRT